MDLDLARGMMIYVADLLKFPCPNDLPEIRAEPDLECLGQIRWPLLQGPVIALRHWREGSLKDQSVLVHELVHWIQHCNGVEMTGKHLLSVRPDRGGSNHGAMPVAPVCRREPERPSVRGRDLQG